ncbi:MAG: hypothetical protein MZW92_79855 [Comamonadaceae bacterium]|nr:hypothetical protein [Comamonadaceae bacterium]
MLPYAHAPGRTARLPAAARHGKQRQARHPRRQRRWITPPRPILWGGPGTVGQHAYHQLLYQGTRRVAIDFVVPVGRQPARQQEALVANALAQTAALMLGKTRRRGAAGSRSPAAWRREEAAPARAPCRLPGQPAELDPARSRRSRRVTLGRLIALYEHKVFVQGWIWGINSFDQYGVELGKQMARSLASGQPRQHGPACTAGLMREIRAMRSRSS